MFKLFNCLVNYGVVLLLVVVSCGWVDDWCTDVSWVWRLPNRNAAALLRNNNIRNDHLLHQGTGVLHDLVCRSPKLRSIILPLAAPPKRRVLHRGWIEDR
jgi:hypothetical protein